MKTSSMPQGMKRRGNAKERRGNGGIKNRMCGKWK